MKNSRNHKDHPINREVNMHCKQCGAKLPNNTPICNLCGNPTYNNPTYNNPTGYPTYGGRVGYSERIQDPAFANYIKSSNKWSVIFSVILAIAAVIGFFIYGEKSRDMDNPQALFIGLGLGGLFLLIALFTILARKRSKTWDGLVVDKTIKNKSRHQSSGSGDDDYYVVHYTEYTVIIRDEKGKKHFISAEDDDTKYNYYQIGDRVRHHQGLNSYEKFDKSRDNIIFCNACGSLCDISDDYCYRCKCPLLK